jgi:hypothetical protein
MTTALGTTHRHLVRRRSVDATALMSSVGHLGLGTVGLLLVLISAWGGIIPFVGPSFGYSADGAGSWHWSLTHVVVSMVPGVVGVLIGLVVLANARGFVYSRGRLRLSAAGLITIACGAWFAVAPWAWPVINTNRTYFVVASPLRLLADVTGYGLGPGIIVVACGAFFMGWASRHQKVGTTLVRNKSVPAAEAAPAEA